MKVLTIRDIAKKTGISRPTLSKYFDSISPDGFTMKNRTLMAGYKQDTVKAILRERKQSQMKRQSNKETFVQRQHRLNHSMDGRGFDDKQQAMHQLDVLRTQLQELKRENERLAHERTQPGIRPLTSSDIDAQIRQFESTQTKEVPKDKYGLPMRARHDGIFVIYDDDLDAQKAYLHTLYEKNDLLSPDEREQEKKDALKTYNELKSIGDVEGAEIFKKENDIPDFTINAPLTDAEARKE